MTGNVNDMKMMTTPISNQWTKTGPFRFFRGRQEDPPWVRPSLLALLILTAVAYMWGLNQSGWSNSFYSAAVQAATKSWKAFFFGSLDASNYITVDKPPASLWVMDLSARIFGLNSWSILVPEALEGVATVAILYSTVRRWFSPEAALLAAAALATTPVAALMFRFNNPDALLVLLLTASVYAVTRSLEGGKTKWLLLASVLIGFGFLTKMLAAFLVIPAFVVVYLIFAPVSVWKRLLQISLSAIAVVVSAGWWVAIVQLIPAADRPYIGSSQNNSILNLIFGYNGLGRLSGNESGGMGTQGFSGGGSMGANFSGPTGLFRLFEVDMGGQISWLIPAALILFFVTVCLIWRNWKMDRAMPALILWFLVFFVTAVVFSFGKGVIHTYYTVALAPAIAALVGIGVDVLRRRKDEIVARIGLGGAVLVTALWSYVLLDRNPTWVPWLRYFIVVIGILATIGLVIGSRLPRSLRVVTMVAGLMSVFAGPVAYTFDTVMTPHTGSTPSAGPTLVASRFANGSGGTPGGDSPAGGPRPGESSTEFAPNFESASTQSAGTGTKSSTGSNRLPGFGERGPYGGNAGGPGGGNGATPSAALIELLQKNASTYTWVLATSSSMTSAPYQLASGEPVMAMGGFTGSDAAITLAKFESYVKEGKIHYYIAESMGAPGGFSGGGPGDFGRNSNGESAYGVTTGGFANGGAKSGFRISPGGHNATSAITKWVESNFTTLTVGGVTLYDLTQPKA